MNWLPARAGQTIVGVAEGGKTKYTACVLRPTVADREAHEKLGFHQGWGQCADPLVELVTDIRKKT